MTERGSPTELDPSANSSQTSRNRPPRHRASRTHSSVPMTTYALRRDLSAPLAQSGTSTACRPATLAPSRVRVRTRVPWTRCRQTRDHHCDLLHPRNGSRRRWGTRLLRPRRTARSVSRAATRACFPRRARCEELRHRGCRLARRRVGIRLWRRDRASRRLRLRGRLVAAPCALQVSTRRSLLQSLHIDSQIDLGSMASATVLASKTASIVGRDHVKVPARFKTREL